MDRAIEVLRQVEQDSQPFVGFMKTEYEAHRGSFLAQLKETVESGERSPMMQQLENELADEVEQCTYRWMF